MVASLFNDLVGIGLSVVQRHVDGVGTGWQVLHVDAFEVVDLCMDQTSLEIVELNVYGF